MNALSPDLEIWVRLGLFALMFLILALAEVRWPRRQRNFSRQQRWATNLGLSLANSLILRLLVPMAGVAGAVWATDRDVGLFNLLTLPPWLEIALFILLFDLTIYGQHRLFHAIPLLWRLHRVHHTDEDYDLTTGNRFHPFSILLSALIKLALIVTLGASALAVLLAELILNLMSMFNHSNLGLPRAVDQILRTVIVTPDMHRIHHSRNQTEHNKNFGFNFSFWDRMLGTYLEAPEGSQESLVFGIDGFTGKTTRTIPALLKQPLLAPSIDEQ